jgi:hypothetical protein
LDRSARAFRFFGGINAPGKAPSAAESQKVGATGWWPRVLFCAKNPSGQQPTGGFFRLFGRQHLRVKASRLIPRLGD